MNNTKHHKSISTAICGFVCLLPLVVQAEQPGFPTSIGTNPVTVAEYRVVGVTTTKTNGAPRDVDGTGHEISGFAFMDWVCQQKVDPHSRMTTVQEWHTARGFPYAGETVWLDPGPLAVVRNENDGGSWFAYGTAPRGPDPIGSDAIDIALANQSCHQYQEPHFAVFGTVGRSDGSVWHEPCDTTHHIACSALVAVPVRQ